MMLLRQRIKELEQENMELRSKIIMEMQQSNVLLQQIVDYQDIIKTLLEKIENNDQKVVVNNHYPYGCGYGGGGGG